MVLQVLAQRNRRTLVKQHPHDAAMPFRGRVSRFSTLDLLAVDTVKPVKELPLHDWRRRAFSIGLEFREGIGRKWRRRCP